MSADDVRAWREPTLAWGTDDFTLLFFQQTAPACISILAKSFVAAPAAALRGSSPSMAQARPTGLPAAGASNPAAPAADDGDLGGARRL